MSHTTLLDACRLQYRAMFMMLQEAIGRCPDAVWDLRDDEPPFWQQACHTLQSVDFYLSDSPEAFEADPGFEQGADELDKAPVTAATREQMLEYLGKVERKCTALLTSHEEASFDRRNLFYWTGPTVGHHLVYNLRHAQHHIGWMNSILRRHRAEPAEWVCSP